MFFRSETDLEDFQRSFLRSLLTKPQKTYKISEDFTDLFLDIFLVNFIWVNLLYIHKRVNNEEYNNTTMVTGG